MSNLTVGYISNSHAGIRTLTTAQNLQEWSKGLMSNQHEQHGLVHDDMTQRIA